jgi:hypothetical protein
MTRFVVLLRRRSPDPLELAETIEASEAEARSGALQRWAGSCIELVLAPEEAIRWVLKDPLEKRDRAQATTAR